MRKLLRKILLRPVLWAASRFSSRPNRERIFAALTSLYKDILEKPGDRGIVITCNPENDKFIIFSDQHKGRRNGADDFMLAEPNYLAALDHYYKADFTFINLGDSEELWENNLWQVKKMNKANFDAEKKFLLKGKYVKVFGNHDLFWDNDPFAGWQLRSIFKQKVKVYEGVVLQLAVGCEQLAVDSQQLAVDSHQSAVDSLRTQTPFSSMVGEPPVHIFLTHGHQGDAQSDGNWFSKFFVAKIWAPLQSLLRINPNTPAYDAEKKTLHNSIMYEWSASQQNLLLVTGHTHQPVFASLTHLERLYKSFQLAEKNKNAGDLQKLLDEIKKREKEFTAVAADYMTMRSTYFNTGCCCFSDGDISGIEIEGGEIRLVKWTIVEGVPERRMLEGMHLPLLK
ncbi:MAG: metallophosphoesterase [Bacteroidetes bacterium]|nr:metallophosphoesterase [Bacteroidota bacterium]